ncbi:exo-alpha-sialidase [Oxalobacteraceae bacterium A2-2]
MSTNAWLATRKGLFELARVDDGAWALADPVFVGDPVSMVLPDPRDGSVYAALHLGHFGAKLHRRAPDGVWSEVAAPAYPPKPADSEDKTEWTLRQIWSLAAGGADQPGLLWAGTLPGGLFVSRDHGASWALVDALWNAPERSQWMGGGYDVPGIHSICVDPRNSNSVLVGVSCGGAWLTTDGGASWSLRAHGMRASYMPPELADSQAIQDPHRIVRCPGQPDQLWCQHHNGIWRSVDNGAHWTGVDTGELPDFGFVTAVHPQHGEVAWFVPAEADQRRVPRDAALMVTRTGPDGMQALRDGLPQRHCYDLVYRHGLAVADDGRTLLMGSTTGSVWLSEDGGQRWRTISTHLPPVYAVAFGSVA